MQAEPEKEERFQLWSWVDSLSSGAYWSLIAAICIVIFLVGVAFREYILFPEGGG
ncbi:MAG: hypothetical protein WBL19_00785 [Minisyncoccia bacterium]